MVHQAESAGGNLTSEIAQFRGTYPGLPINCVGNLFLFILLILKIEKGSRQA
jgi:hypothetical protein